MKKIILLAVFVFLSLMTKAQLPSQMSIYDYGDRIHIRDSSKLDTAYIPYVIMKENITIEPVWERGKSAPIKLYHKFYKFGQEPYLIMTYKEFDQFTSNAQLGEWLDYALAEDYNNVYQYDGSNNLIEHRRYFLTTLNTDTTWVELKDTLIYDGSNNLTNFNKITDDSNW